MMKKLGKRDVTKVIFFTLSSFVVYMLTGVFFLRSALFPATAEPKEKIPYTQARGEFFVLVSCEELSRYCALQLDFDGGRLTATLFDSKEDAIGYGFDYDKTVTYGVQAAYDIIGRIGGIVLGKESGFHIGLGEAPDTRVFGPDAIAIAARSRESRAAVCYAFLRALLSYDLQKEDFGFFADTCKTNISYKDYCNYWENVRQLCNNINIVMG